MSKGHRCLKWENVAHTIKTKFKHGLKHIMNQTILFTYKDWSSQNWDFTQHVKLTYKQR